MELKIKDRDYVADGAGGLVRVSGWDELLERVGKAARRRQSNTWPRHWRMKRA